MEIGKLIRLSSPTNFEYLISASNWLKWVGITTSFKAIWRNFQVFRYVFGIQHNIYVANIHRFIGILSSFNYDCNNRIFYENCCQEKTLQIPTYSNCLNTILHNNQLVVTQSPRYLNVVRVLLMDFPGTLITYAKVLKFKENFNRIHISAHSATTDSP